MAVKKSPPIVDDDLEATAELPVFDFTAGASSQLPALSESAVVTDVFPAPVVQVGVAELADSLREVEQRLQRKIERVQALEQELEESRAAAQRLAGVEQELGGVRDALTEARQQLQAQRDALGETRQAVEQRATAQRQQEQELAQLRRRTEQQHEVLCTWQGFRAVSEAMLVEAESTARSVQHDALAAAQARALQAEAQCAERDARIAALDAQLAELRAVEQQMREGAERHAAQQQRIALLEAELDDTRLRLHGSEALTGQTADRLRRLEAEAQASAAVLGNLQQNMERLGRDDTGSRPALKPVDLVLRVLIRHEGGSDVVYPLGRRTTIGRIAENDIQVDTTYVSRHHAVLLSSADHCIVEDLNSTNGVLVNGHRVGRQILRDGDMVTVGRTEFRYQQTP